MAVILPAGAPGTPEAAAAALAGGEVVAIPTDTVYGLAASPSVPGAVAALFRAKERPEGVAVAVLVAGPAEGRGLMASPSPAARAAMQRWWPGPLTLVVPRGRASTGFDLGGDPSTIGLRCPDHALVRHLAGLAGPLATTSANRHGQPTPTTAAGVAAVLGDSVAMVVDGGPCTGAPSTVVDLTGGAPVLLREGRLAWADVLALVAPGGGRASGAGE